MGVKRNLTRRRRYFQGKPENYVGQKWRPEDDPNLHDSKILQKIGGLLALTSLPLSMLRSAGKALT
jgi:hypothetical protein